MKKIVVIPSDKLDSYEKKGMSEMEIQNYYNPNGFYDKVYAISKFETGINCKYGMTIIGAKKKDLPKWISEINPTIIRAYDGFKSADYIIGLKKYKVPIIISIHDAREELMHYSLRYADGIICMSNIIKEKFIKKFPNYDRNRLYILPNRVDCNIFTPSVDEKFEERMNRQYGEKFHILHVGRKSPEKNIDTMIKALKLLPDSFCMIFAGRGDVEPYLQLSVREGVQNRCYFLENIIHEDLPEWFSWCDCMCTPSRTEGFGMVFIEAAAAGGCIITSNTAPMNEYLSHMENAYLVDDYENPLEIANAIKICCESTYLRDKLKKGAIDVGMNFNKESIDKRENELMNSLFSLKVLPKGLGVYFSIIYDYILDIKAWFFVIKRKYFG